MSTGDIRSRDERGRRLFQVAILVRDYDEALEFYCGKLGFRLVEDTVLSATKRWVVVSPGSDGADILLARAATPEQTSRVGNQTGGRVFLFLHTADLDGELERLRAAGIELVRAPKEEAWGRVAVFADLYGNLWDLIQPAS